VTVARPVQRIFTPYQLFNGRLQPLRAIEVRPAVNGVVKSVNFTAGAEVKKGDLLFELESDALALTVQKAQAELTLAEAKKRQAEVDLEMKRELARTALTTRQEADKSAAQVAAAAANIEVAKVEVARARLDFDATKIRAPMSGQVGRPLVEPGTLVLHGPDHASLLTTVSCLDPIGLSFDIDERSFLDYQRLLREKQVKGAGSSLYMAVASDTGFPREGTLASFGDHIDTQSGTVPVRGSFPNPGQVLLPGMFARVRISFGLPRKVLVVPEESMLSDQGNNYVLVVGEDNIVQRRAVTQGSPDNAMRIIEKGVNTDDWVVIAGLAHLRPGARVAPEKTELPKRSDLEGKRDQ
jgi:multidrug efflux system membrane fusion protein